MLTLLLCIAVAFFSLAYFGYGRFLDRKYNVNPHTPTPSHTDYDGIDRVPAHPAVLFGHHFSSIAGAGPIVGPIIAATAFGWAPTLAWIIIGAIFIGGVHDFSALMASLRHKARSIAEISREYVSPLSYKLFLVFIWLALVYVLTVFLDLTASTFVANGGVASSSLMFIALAVGFGVCIYRFKMPVVLASLIFVPLVFAAVWFGQKVPIDAAMVPAVIANNPAKTWDILLLAYCLLASTLPVWLLLQPRDYLSSFLLYAAVLGGFVGILFGGFPLSYPAFKAWSAPSAGMLIPMLFITVACGACSGFHSIVASGTTPKQIDKESHARPVAYGGMLVEGLVAVIALATVAMLPLGDPSIAQAPLTVFATGLANFLGFFHIPHALGVSFGLLALSTFILTTLDTATRLARYLFEEFFSMTSVKNRYVSTLATLALPAVFVLITLKDPVGNPIPAWKAIWPVFGATNQLLAGLALMVVVVWLKKSGKNVLFALIPMVFMIGMTLWALALLIVQYRFSLIGMIAAVLFLLALTLIVDSLRIFVAKKPILKASPS